MRGERDGQRREIDTTMDVLVDNRLILVKQIRR